jgi:hypothetical protein
VERQTGEYRLISACLILALAAAGCAPRPEAPREQRRLVLRVQESQDEAGNMHYAERVEVSSGRGRPLVLVTDVEKGVLAPLVGRQVPVGQRHALLLGWSSWGAGMETVQAILVRVDPDGVVLQDRLELTTDRSSAGVLLRTDGGRVRIGVPRPAEPAHHGEDWALSFAGRRLDLAGIRSLRYAPRTGADAAAACYCPPLDIEPPGAEGPIAWFLAGEAGFRQE